ncbi:MAG: FliM/FliN family flagellar motor switch protein, partial [SAR324 cluster bacterium]|nr:FliM/FliN family flagellar motor switch protein [SAR324 cluster bacterium]
VEIGKANLKGEDITSLTYGSVIELDRKKGDPVDIILGNKIIAHGEVVQINEEQLGVRITRLNY